MKDKRFEKNNDAITLEELLHRDYGYLSTKLVESEIVVKTMSLLTEYKDSLELYEGALSKYEHEKFERNALDDMRLALELLVKELLDNNKSLENQKAEIGAFLKTKDISAQSRNMLISLIGYYTDFHNTYVKHNDNVPKDEVEFIIEITSIIMIFLIRQYNE